jgi:hypothetical protein
VISLISLIGPPSHPWIRPEAPLGGDSHELSPNSIRQGQARDPEAHPGPAFPSAGCSLDPADRGCADGDIPRDVFFSFWLIDPHMKKSEKIGVTPRKGVGCRGKPGPGRPRGLKNAITRDLRTVITEFVQHNIGDAQLLYNRVKRRNPERALRILSELADFALPRLNRTELTVTPPAEEREPITVSNASDAAEVYEAMMWGTTPATEMVIQREPAALPAPPEPSPPVQEATPVTPRAPAPHPIEIPVAPIQEPDAPTAKPEPIASPGRCEEASRDVEAGPPPRQGTWNRILRLDDPVGRARKAENEARQEIENERIRRDAAIRASRMEPEDEL